jgi:hypothetical protein
MASCPLPALRQPSAASGCKGHTAAISDGIRLRNHEWSATWLHELPEIRQLQPTNTLFPTLGFPTSAIRSRGARRQRRGTRPSIWQAPGSQAIAQGMPRQSQRECPWRSVANLPRNRLPKRRLPNFRQLLLVPQTGDTASVTRGTRFSTSRCVRYTADTSSPSRRSSCRC